MGWFRILVHFSFIFLLLTHQVRNARII